VNTPPIAKKPSVKPVIICQFVDMILAKIKPQNKANRAFFRQMAISIATSGGSNDKGLSCMILTIFLLLSYNALYRKR
jgi:hypothetical protein